MLFFLSRERKTSIERWLRGRREYRKIELADCVVVTWAKSGRTWFRLMLSRFYQIKYGLSERRFLEFDNLNKINPEIPKVFFTHGNYLRDYRNNWNSKSEFYDKKIVFLVRDPRDVAVSQYFQWKHRMHKYKKFLNDYPEHGEDLSLYDFVMNRDAGLRRIVGFFNLWASEMPRVRDIMVVRYEDMRKAPETTLKEVLAFMGTPGSDAEIKEAVAFASYDNMKRIEEQRIFWASGRRLVPGKQGNPESYKVRRAKVGGYRDYFDEDQIAEIDRYVDANLSPVFGYGAASQGHVAV